jgi:hypothetical protein
VESKTDGTVFNHKLQITNEKFAQAGAAILRE